MKMAKGAKKSVNSLKPAAKDYRSGKAIWGTRDGRRAGWMAGMILHLIQ